MTLAPVAATASLESRARTVAEIAAEHAAAVDADARFPFEAVDALKSTGLLGASVPVAFGGEGLSLEELAAITAIIATGCASTAMVFAMHHSQVVSLGRHLGENTVLADLAHRIVDEQLLVASATTEITTGGDVRSSTCFVDRQGDRVTLAKSAPVISYGEHADVIFITARATGESAPDEQVLLVAERDQLILEPTGGWDTLGLRGTCSRGYQLTATVSPDAVLPDDYATILTQSMGPACHVLWGAAWLGIARGSVDAARRYIQAAARKTIGVTPPGATHLVGLVAELETFESLVGGAARDFDRRAHDRDALSSVGYVLSINNLKVTASTLVAQVVADALRITGIAGYRNDGPYSVARAFRDAQGAAVMVSNDRIVSHNARLVLMQKGSKT